MAGIGGVCAVLVRLSPMKECPIVDKEDIPLRERDAKLVFLGDVEEGV